MVDCYCGCDTQGNRIKFAVSGALYFLGINIVLGIQRFLLTCSTEASEECEIISFNKDEEAFEKYNCDEVDQQVVDCIGSPAYLRAAPFLLFGELLMILATVPLCVLCCCTKKPPQEALIQAPTAVHQDAHYDRI